MLIKHSRLKYLQHMEESDPDRVGYDGEEEGCGNDLRGQFVVAAHFPRVNEAVNSAGRGPKDVGDAQFYGAQSHDHTQGDEDEGSQNRAYGRRGEHEPHIFFTDSKLKLAPIRRRERGVQREASRPMPLSRPA